MQNWKSWQVVFLAYLLLLNVIVLGSLAYVVFNYDFWLSPQPTSVALAIGPLASPTSTLLPTLRPTLSPSAMPLQPGQAQTDELSKIDNTATPTPIPPINIPPASPPSKAISKSFRESTAMPTRPTSPHTLESSES